MAAPQLVRIAFDDALLGDLVDLEQTELGLGADSPIADAAIGRALTIGLCARRRSTVQYVGVEMLAILEQPHVENRAFARSALGPDRAAMQLDQVFGQRQPDAGAAVAARLAHVGLEEARKNSLGQLGWEADPGVLDLHQHGLAGVAHADRNLAFGVGELGCVREQVQEHALHPLQVAPHERRLAIAFELELDALALD